MSKDPNNSPLSIDDLAAIVRSGFADMASKADLDTFAAMVQAGFADTASKADLDILRSTLASKADLTTLRSDFLAFRAEIVQQLNRLEKSLPPKLLRRVTRIEEALNLDAS